MEQIKYKKLWLVIIILLILIIIGFSFSYFQFRKTTESIKKFNTDCFDIKYQDKTKGINLEKAYPISDEDGLKTVPYKFSVTNICPYDMDLNIKLNMIRNTTLDSKYVKVSLGNDVKLKPTKLSDCKEVDYDNSKYIDSKILSSISLKQYQTIEIDFRMWVDQEAKDNEGSNAYMSSKIEVEGFNK